MIPLEKNKNYKNMIPLENQSNFENPIIPIPNREPH